MSSRYGPERTQLPQRRTPRARKARRGVPRVALGAVQAQGARRRWARWKGGETAVETAAPPETQGQQLVQGQVNAVAVWGESGILFSFIVSLTRRWFRPFASRADGVRLLGSHR